MSNTVTAAPLTSTSSTQIQIEEESAMSRGKVKCRVHPYCFQFPVCMNMECLAGSAIGSFRAVHHFNDHCRTCHRGRSPHFTGRWSRCRCTRRGRVLLRQYVQPLDDHTIGAWRGGRGLGQPSGSWLGDNFKRRSAPQILPGSAPFKADLLQCRVAWGLGEVSGDGYGERVHRPKGAFKCIIIPLH